MNATSSWLSRVAPRLKKLSLFLSLSIALTVFVASENGGDEASAVADLDSGAAGSRPGPALTYALKNGTTLKYVGMFTSDAKYRVAPKHWYSDAAVIPGPEQKEAPPWLLRSNERVIEPSAPPAHATVMVQGESLGRRGLAGVVTFVYGHLQVLQAPQAVVTDSAQRVIVADPAIPAVHVLDPVGKKSFRILGGFGRRLESADEIAVDGEDNIYVVDSVRDLVVVFDRDGRFLREIGAYSGESQYEHLTAIAIDSAARHIYLTDGPRHLLIMLDLYGNVLKRVGAGWSDGRPGELRRRDVGPKEFDSPTDVAVGGGELVVLDKGGTRIHILDLNCKLLRGFSVQRAAEDQAVGIGVDNGGNIYVAYAGTSLLRAYSSRGEMLGSVGYEAFCRIRTVNIGASDLRKAPVCLCSWEHSMRTNRTRELSTTF